MILNQFTDDDLVAVRVCRKAEDGGDFIVASIYMPYDSTLQPPGPLFEKLDKYRKEERIPMIVGADSNSHHTIWGSTNINKRDEDLVEYLMTSDFLILNKGKAPTFTNAVREEILDVTWITSDLSEMAHSWKVVNEETFSDHKLIKFCLRGHFQPRMPIRNPRKTKWDTYREKLKERLDKMVYSDRFLTKHDLDRANQDITAAMVDAYRLSCPLTNPKPLYRKSLWSNDLERKRKELRKAWNRAGK